MSPPLQLASRLVAGLDGVTRYRSSLAPAGIQRHVRPKTLVALHLGGGHMECLARRNHDIPATALLLTQVHLAQQARKRRVPALQPAVRRDSKWNIDHYLVCE